MKIKLGQVLVEELKKSGIELEEEAIHEIQKILFEKALPRAIAESTDPTEKGIEAFILSMYPILKPALEKIEDLNHDGKIGL